MSKIFPKINFNFYIKPNLWICLVITLQHILFLVINITIPVVIFIQCIKRTISLRLGVHKEMEWNWIIIRKFKGIE